VNLTKIISHWVTHLIAILMVIISFLFVSIIYFNNPGPLNCDKIIIIPKGSSTKKISHILAKEEIIKFPSLFWLIAKISSTQYMQYGEYLFEKQSSPKNILKILSNGKTIIHKLTIIEGITNFDIYTKLESIDILNDTFSKNYPEGSFLPETYYYSYGDSRQDILNKMNKQLEIKLDEIWKNKSDNLPYKNKEELMTMASIIEKETGKEEERPRIAAVFINRLKLNIKLQADPTVVYAITNGKPPLNRKLNKSDLQIDSPFNTYLYYGLPPSPISNPGIASITAAANPLSSKELYFVAIDNESGKHNFASSLDEHNKNVQTYRNKLKSSNIND
jgi:UPF0755 protein